MNKLLALLLAFILIKAAIALPDEAIGRVVTVVTGDTFGIEFSSPDPRTRHIDQVKLADIAVPSTLTPEGKDSKKFTTSILNNKTVFLDIDDNTTSGRNDVGQLVCIVYLMDSNSRPVWPCVNRILVDSGYATLSDDRHNEFNATVWWQPPPAMKVGKSTAATKSIENNNDEFAIVKKIPNSAMVDIGYRVPKATGGYGSVEETNIPIPVL
ncbi:MAG: hypothetical protein ACE14P_08245 [Methanotrichaceae archaeon]